MKTIRKLNLLVAVLVCALVGTAAHAQSAAKEKAPPATADQSAYATAA